MLLNTKENPHQRDPTGIVKAWVRIPAAAAAASIEPVKEDHDVGSGDVGRDFDEEVLLPHHDGRLRVDDHHEQVGVAAFDVDPASRGFESIFNNSTAAQISYLAARSHISIFLLKTFQFPFLKTSQIIPGNTATGNAEYFPQ